MSAEIVLLATANLAGLLTAWLQFRSRKSRQDFQRWLIKHAGREEESTKKMMRQHREVIDAVKAPRRREKR